MLAYVYFHASCHTQREGGRELEEKETDGKRDGHRVLSHHVFGIFLSVLSAALRDLRLRVQTLINTGVFISGYSRASYLGSSG